MLFRTPCPPSYPASRPPWAGPCGRETPTTPEKRTFRFGFPAEDGYGYAQAVETQGTIYISGQVAFDKSGAIDQAPGAEAQMRRAYTNARAVLAHFGVGPDAVVDELVFIKGGLAEAMEFVGRVRKEFYGEHPEVASTIVETPRLAMSEFLVEIKLVAKL
jgi:enamine deaminase RidA (YjgF/YER057c/UK114 family)